MAECVQLTDEVVGPAIFVDASFAEVRTKVDKSEVWVIEEVPDRDEDRTGDRDECTLTASSSHKAPIAPTEEGVGARCCRGDLTEDALQVGVPLASSPSTGPWPGLDRAWRQLRP